MADTNLAAALAKFTDRVLRWTAQSMEDLSQDEVHFRTYEGQNCIGFEAWHIARTADNLIHFAFEREQPIWMSKGLFEQWGLPKVDQGTGTSFDEVSSWVFPDGPTIASYLNDVADVIVPRIADMTPEYLDSITRIVPQGELPKWEIIGQVIINHSNNHLGQINVGRSMQGKEGLGF